MNLLRMSGVSIFDVTTQLNALIEPVDASAQEIIWSSSDADIVKVDPVTGKVTGVKLGGSAIITAKLIDENNSNTEHTASIEVKVGIVGDEKAYCQALPDELIGNDVYEIFIPVNIEGARTITLELLDGSSVIGTGSKDVDLLGKTSVPVQLELPSVAPIGMYTLKTTISEGTDIISECTSEVNMLDVIHVESIKIAEGQTKLQVNKELQLSVEILPLDAFDKSITWKSDNESVAIVDENGIVTGKVSGDATIQAITNDGKMIDEVTISVQNDEVIEKPTALIIEEKVSVFPNNTYAFDLEYVNSWATEKEVKWESSNPSVASVDNNGKVTAGASEGDVIITVTSLSNETVSATCNLSVSYTITVEAEEYSSMGGAVGDIKIGEVGINNVQKGDYVEYTVEIPESGIYSATFFAATEVENGVIQLVIDDEEIGEKQVPSDKWDNYHPIEIADNIELLAGTHTIKLNATGTSDWQWNLEHFELTKVGDLTLPEGVQHITLKKGWNLVSLYIQPNECRDARPCVSTVLPNAEIVKTMDVFYEASLPEFMNSLQIIKQGVGYLVYNSIDEIIEVSGTSVEIDGNVTLKAGWNLIGYPYKENKPIETALSSIWDKVELVKDFEGFYHSTSDPAFNSLEVLQWGKGYFVKVSEDCELKW